MYVCVCGVKVKCHCCICFVIISYTHTQTAARSDATDDLVDWWTERFGLDDAASNSMRSALQVGVCVCVCDYALENKVLKQLLCCFFV